MSPAKNAGREYTMPENHFARITHSFESCHRLVSRWALECDKIVVYEHVGTQTEKIHIHLLILGSRLGKKQLRNIGQSFVDLKGNKNCSFKVAESYDVPVTYMTKGVLQPKYNKGFTEEYLEERRKAWVEPSQVKSKDQIAYEDCFSLDDWKNRWLPKDCKECVYEHPRESCHFKQVCRKAWSYASYARPMVNAASLNLYKSLVWTYCRDEGISIPREHPLGKWY